MRGFTLIESIVYIVLFALLLSSTITGTESLTESIERSHTNSLLETEGNFLIAKIALDPIHVDEVSNTLVDTKTSPSTPLSSPKVFVSEFSHSLNLYTFTLSALTDSGQKVTDSFSVSPTSLP